MNTNKWNRFPLRGALLFLSLISFALNCSAHPMGNFSVNHYSRITISRSSVEVLYLIDMAEIPTFQAMRQRGFSQASDDPKTARYLEEKTNSFKDGLSLDIDGQMAQLDPVSRDIAFTDGAAGLPTMKIKLKLEAKLKPVTTTHKLSYVDRNFSGRAGWKEIVLLGDGITIVDTSASKVDRSQQLMNYSSDVLNSPPQQLSALATFKLHPLENLADRSEKPVAAPTPSVKLHEQVMSLERVS